MSHIRIETFVAAPPERVFDCARDLDLHARSLAHTGEQAVGGRTSGLIGPGEEVEWRARHLGIRWRLRSRISEFDRPHRFADVQVRGPFARFEHRHTFVRVDRGTLMIDEWTHDSPLGVLGRLADVLVLERHMRRVLKARVREVKRAAESHEEQPTGDAGVAA
jgi:ligand-binding SRPBCC domain-containing protein